MERIYLKKTIQHMQKGFTSWQRGVYHVVKYKQNSCAGPLVTITDNPDNWEAHFITLQKKNFKRL